MGDAQAISLETGSRDAVVSALMLNFVPDKLKALMEMKRVARSGASVGVSRRYRRGGLMSANDPKRTIARRMLTRAETPCSLSLTAR